MKKHLITIFVVIVAVVVLGWFLFSRNSDQAEETEQAEEPELESQVIEDSKEPAPEPISLLAVGDIIPARYVYVKMKRAGDMTLPFRETYQVTSDADISFANVDTPISDLVEPLEEGMTFVAPTETMEGLEFGGFDVISQAGNHPNNYGGEVLLDSMKNLEEAGFYVMGAGADVDEANKPAIVEVKDQKIAFFAYDNVIPVTDAATASKPGVAWMDIDTMTRNVSALKKAGSVDYIIVSMHSGTEYEPEPNQEQINFARAAIDAGANLVIGHHPHIIQTKEEYNGGYIIYSLGNFIFDQMWADYTRKGEIFKCTLHDGKVEDIEFIPVTIYDYNQPRVEE